MRKALYTPRLNRNGQTDDFTLPEMWYRQETELSMAALEKKLSRWMAVRSLPASDDSLGAVLGILAAMIEDGTDLVSTLTEFETLIRTVDATHLYVLSGLVGSGGWGNQLTWQGFRFERLNGEALVTRCKKAGALLFAASASHLDGAPSFLSPIFKRTTFDFAELFWRRRSPAIQKHGVALLQAYFEAASDLHVDAMWRAIEDAFLLPDALGLHYFNFTELRWLPGAEVWTFYDGLGPDRIHSWIGKLISLHPIKVPKFDQAAIALEELEKRHQFPRLKASPLFPLLESVSRSLARSTGHLLGERVDESFLFLIIAIEQVFSEKEKTTQAVASRTAIVAHRHLGMDYATAKKHVADLYDARSRFVHQGKPATIDDRMSADELGAAVIRCLMRLCLMPAVTAEGFHEGWQRRLDYLVAGIEAGKQPSDADLVENGIIDPVSESAP